MDKKGLAKPRVYQTKIKIYPDGSTVLTVYKNAIVYRGSAEKESDDFVEIDSEDEDYIKALGELNDEDIDEFLNDFLEQKILKVGKNEYKNKKFGYSWTKL